MGVGLTLSVSTCMYSYILQPLHWLNTPHHTNIISKSSSH